MIDVHLLLAFAAAVVVLMLIPGPNVALIVGTSVSHGARFGLLTVAGTTAAMLVQLLCTGLGMGTLLGAFGHWFGVLRWIGVAYLCYLGVAQWRAKVVDLSALRTAEASPRRVLLRALLVSLTNPKTLFFYGAFFPQFISPAHGLLGQLALLSLTFVLLALAIDSGWALLASRARGLLSRHARLRNRVSGGLLIGAGLGLAAARVR
jgi:threonine/homoserine/homoserine lactone efflux protein